MDPRENLDKTIEEITAEEVVASTPKEEVVAAKDEVVFADKPKKKGKGMVISMALLGLLAGGGIGFGVWAYLAKNQESETLNNQITTLKDQNSDLLEQLGIEGDDTTIVDIDTDAANVKYVFSSGDASGLAANTSMTVSSVAYTGIRFSLDLDGSVGANYQWVEWDSYNPEIKNQRRENDTLTDYIKGKVVDISTGHIGNGSFGVVFFLLDNGTIQYMQEDDILSKKYNAKELSGASNAVRVYGNLANQDYAGFMQSSSGKITPIILDKFEGNDTILKVE